MEKYLIMDKDLNVLFCGTLEQIDAGFCIGSDPTEEDAKIVAQASGLALYRLVE